MKIAVVYHSGTGRTKIQAEAVAAGCRSVAGAEVELVAVDQAENRWDYLNQVDAIIFGCPTYMGSVSSAFKKFMEDSSGIWYKQLWKDKIAAGFTNSGGLSGDKLNTLVDMVVFAGQHGMIWVNMGWLQEHKREGQLVNRLGGFIGAMSQTPQGEERPVADDLATAELHGRRVAEATARWLAGKTPAGA